MDSDADWASTAAADGYVGTHRGKGRHRANGEREITGQIAQPFAAPGETKPAPGLEVGRDRDT